MVTISFKKKDTPVENINEATGCNVTQNGDLFVLAPGEGLQPGQSRIVYMVSCGIWAKAFVTDNLMVVPGDPNANRKMN